MALHFGQIYVSLKLPCLLSSVNGGALNGCYRPLSSDSEVNIVSLQFLYKYFDSVKGLFTLLPPRPMLAAHLTCTCSNPPPSVKG